MQGHLHEIDIRSILQLVEVGQRTGQLCVESYGTSTSLSEPSRSAGLSWFVFFLNGQMIYATRSDIHTERLVDHLNRYHLHLPPEDLISPSELAVHVPEYGCLWSLLERHLITPAQGRSIIRSLIYETLFDLLGLHQGAFIFEMGSPLSPQLMPLEISPMILKIAKQVQEWKQFHPLILSPDQCLVQGDVDLQTEPYYSDELLQVLIQWLDGQHSLRRIARYLHRDIVSVTQSIYPYAQKGMIQVLPLETNESASGPLFLGSDLPKRPPRIVCIDDSLALRQSVEAYLSDQGYEVTSLGNPLKAIGLVFQLRPNLILCDISMPEIDGYEICSMLRHSTLFRQVPIVMLTGKEGFIDRVRASMVGATDYLTKPFSDKELLMLVEKYVGKGQINPPAIDLILDEELDELSPQS
ncbi:MAG: response regulator [Prochlorotrichaceae cyanobacterium]|jgi:twitching motility two-component system response regulator PilG